MAPRVTRRQNNSSNNASPHASNIKGFKYVPREYVDDQDEVGSSTTASLTALSSSDSEREKCSSGSSNNGQDTPPAKTSLKSLKSKARDFKTDGQDTPVKTSLKSLKTPLASPAKTSLSSLKNKATDFVPTLESGCPLLDLNAEDLMDLMAPPPFMPTPGKDCLAGVINNALGSEVWNLNMMDATGYNGEWFTGVEITIPALCAADDEAQQKNQSQVVQTLTKALEELAPNMVVQPADHRAQLCVEFCAADRNKLCMEFSQYCSCPRGDKCRWAHAMIETFMINLIVAPLAWGTVTKDVKSVSAPCPKEPKAARWQPQRPPKAVETQKSPPSGPDSSSEEDVVQIQPMKPLLPPRRPRVSSRKSWADINEDSDDDSVPLSFG